MSNFDRSREKDVRILHIRSGRKGGTQAYTIAVLKNKDGSYYTEYAICGERDQFSKKIGRMIATGRVLKWASTYPGVAVNRQYLLDDLKYIHRKMRAQFNEKAVEVFLDGPKEKLREAA